MECLIHHCLIQTLDCQSNLFIPSGATDDLSDVEKDFLEAKIKKIFAQDKRFCELKSDLKMNELLKEYKPEELITMAQTLSQAIFDMKMKAGLHQLFDLIFVQFRYDEIEYLLMLDTPLKTYYTHHMTTEEGPINRIIQYKAILSEGIGKEDCVLLLDYRNHQIEIKENRIDYQGEKKFLYQDLIFDLKSEMTEKEIFKVAESQVKEISRKYEIDLKETLPALKSSIDECEVFEPLKIAEAVFEKAPIAKMEFKRSVEEAGVPESATFDQARLSKKERTMKFVTEAGIEIIIPSSYLKRKDKVEILNHPDGTTSIEIKNITKLKNR